MYYKGPCNNAVALGMQSRVIPDDKVTASSYYSNYIPGWARLNLNLQAWACDQGVGSWIQVDLGSLRYVTAVATQGRPDHPNWVTTYNVKYSTDGGSFHIAGSTYNGNTNQHTVVRNEIQPAVRARYIRLYPLTWYGYMQLRMELYGC